MIIYSRQKTANVKRKLTTEYQSEQKDKPMALLGPRRRIAMSSFIFGFNVGLVFVGLALFAALFYVTILLLAKNNLFFTIVKEGTAKIILKYGEFCNVVMVYKDHLIDDHGYVRHTNDENEKMAWISTGRLLKEDDDPKDPKAYVIKLPEITHWLPGGIRWIGNPFVYSIHTYRFRWDSLKQDALESGEIVQKTVHHDEVIDFVIVQDDVYATVVKQAETVQMVPLDILIALTIRIVNPYKTLFRVQDWLEQIINLIDPAIRSFVGNHTYENLTTQSKVGGQIQKAAEQGFLSESNMDEEIEQDYGARLKKVGFVTIDPAGARGIKYVEVASKVYEAEQEGKAIRVLADAEAYRETQVYDAVIERGEAGMAIRTAEAIEKAASTGKASIIPIPIPIQEMLGGIAKGLRSDKTGKEGEGK